MATPQGVGGWDELTSNDAARVTVRQFAEERQLDPAFVEAWLNKNGSSFKWYDRTTGEEKSPTDMIGTEHYDSATRTLRVSAEMPHLKRLEQDYEASKGIVERGVDVLTSDETTAGEKFLDVAAPIAGAVGRVGDLATRPLSATSTGLWSLARKHSPTQAVQDAWHEFRTGETNAGAGNYLAEQARASETLKDINPNLPGLLGGVTEMLTDPANAVPLGVIARGASFARSLKGVRAVEEALMASRDARALEFFNSGGRVLKLETEGARGVFVTLKDAEGLEHRIDLSAMYAGGGKPKLKSVPADQELSGVGLEREGASGRVYHSGRPQDFVMDSDGSLRASPVGGDGSGRGAASAAAASAAPSVEQALPLATPTGIRPRVRKAARDVRDLINITKAIPASFDSSGLLNQGGLIAGARPSLIPGAVGDGLRSTVSKDAYEAFKRKLVTSPNHPLREASGLDLTSLAGGEEQFASRFTRAVPGIAASERNFTATLDSLRAHAFDLYADQLTKAGVIDQKAFTDVARFINVSSGRANMGKLEPLANVLSLPLFSPRLLYSKAQTLNPVFYAKLHPAARKVALTELFRATGSLGVTMGLAKMAGASVDLDPFSGGFGLITHDQTSFDLSGGRLRPLRFAFQVADSINKERRGETVKDERKPAALVEKFFRAYLSPAGALSVDAYTGETFDGEEFKGDWKELRRLAPFALEDIREAYQRAGTVGAIKALPAFAGVGVNTRDKRSEPIKPTLSDPVRDELDRLGLDLEHLGKDGKKSASVNPKYQAEGITGDSMRPFGGTTGKPGRQVQGMGVDAQATAKQLSEELETAIGEAISSPDYESFESDDDRAQYLDMIIVNTHKRVMNGVRRDGRGAEMEKEKRVKERLDRMSGPTKGVKNFKL